MFDDIDISEILKVFEEIIDNMAYNSKFVDFITESKNKAGYSIVEVVTEFDGSSIVDVYHVKTSNITPNGKTIIWGKRKNGTFYIKRIEA